jgi:Na+-driven multidrug efflux pump
LYDVRNIILAIRERGTTVPHRTAALTFAGVLLGFKIWSIFLIYLVGGTEGTTTFLLGTHVLWIALPLALIWTPMLFWIRLYRTRRKRQMLLDAEWNVSQEPPVNRNVSDS